MKDILQLPKTDRLNNRIEAIHRIRHIVPMLGALPQNYTRLYLWLLEST
jgi:hypothetical protein